MISKNTQRTCSACGSSYSATVAYTARTKLFNYLCRSCRNVAGCSICFKSGRVHGIFESPVPLSSLQNRRFFTLCSKAICRLFLFETLTESFQWWVYDSAKYTIYNKRQRSVTEAQVIAQCTNKPATTHPAWTVYFNDLQGGYHVK